MFLTHSPDAHSGKKAVVCIENKSCNTLNLLNILLIFLGNINDYKSVALPTELCWQLTETPYIVYIFECQ